MRIIKYAFCCEEKMSDLPSPTPHDEFFEIPEALENELSEISESSKKGYQLLKENRFDEAIECFAQILEKDKENNYALVGLGDAARKRGSYRDAADHYRRCLVFHPGNSYALFAWPIATRPSISTTRPSRSGSSIFSTTIRT